jgi:hypothetical protein
MKSRALARFYAATGTNGSFVSPGGFALRDTNRIYISNSPFVFNSAPTAKSRVPAGSLLSVIVKGAARYYVWSAVSITETTTANGVNFQKPYLS